MPMFTDCWAKRYKGRRKYRFLCDSVRQLGLLVEHHFAATSRFTRLSRRHRRGRGGIGVVAKVSMRATPRSMIISSLAQTTCCASWRRTFAICGGQASLGLLSNVFSGSHPSCIREAHRTANHATAGPPGHRRYSLPVYFRRGQCGKVRPDYHHVKHGRRLALCIGGCFGEVRWGGFLGVIKAGS